MPVADFEIFREQLAINHHAYGHALWEPRPWQPDRPVEVGDVGFIRSGRFHSLFNALRPAEGQSRVPEDYEQLVPEFSDHITESPLSSNHYCSAGINVEPESEYHSFSPDDFPQVSFRHPKKRGAVLSLPVMARRKDTLARGNFSTWIVKQIDRWFAFARGLGLGIEQMEEIILVTGCDRTRSWTNVAFLGNEHNARARFGARVVHDGPAISIEWQCLPEHVQGAVVHRGPDGENLPEDQCVFIRGFRVVRTFGILPKHLEAAAGPSPETDSYDYEPDLEVVSIPATPKYRDPLHILLDYIVERAPECDMFLIHDDDLNMIDGIGDGTSPEALQLHLVMDLLRRSNIEIHTVQCDLSTSSSHPNSNTEVVRVAMFSVQNWTPSQQHSTPSNVPTVCRHREYYFADGDVIFRVENVVFCVHKYFFHRESSYFQSLFRSPSIPCNGTPGSSETNPIVLKDAASEAFAGLCWVFYNPKYSIYTTTVDKWTEILALAQRWVFKEVEQLCIRELQKLSIPPIEKIQIYQAFHIDRSLLAESFAELTLRPEPLSLEEGNKLGIETALRIAQARELSRGTNSRTRASVVRLNDAELRSVIQNAFGLGEEAFFDFAKTGPSPAAAPSHPPASEKT